MRNTFLGSNTPYGFVSRFQNILKPGEGRLFILKGGSGTGKSTLMKKLAAEAEEKGLTVEAYHCSSDPQSLDGVKVLERGIAVVDGTSPHITDTQMYGAFDEIVNLGDCISREKLAGTVERLSELLAKKAACYRSAYAYLGAAGTLYRETAAAAAAASDAARVAEAARSVLRAIGVKERPGRGAQRELFAAAITPSGYFDYTTELMGCRRVAVLSGGFDAVSGAVVTAALSLLTAGGYHADCYLSPMEPATPLTLYVPELDAAVVSKSFLSAEAIVGGTEVDVSRVSSADTENGILKQNLSEAQLLTTFGCERMARAAALHQEIERIYRPAVDFAAVDEKYAYIRSALDQ